MSRCWHDGMAPRALPGAGIALVPRLTVCAHASHLCRTLAGYQSLPKDPKSPQTSALGYAHPNDGRGRMGEEGSLGEKWRSQAPKSMLRRA